MLKCAFPSYFSYLFGCLRTCRRICSSSLGWGGVESSCNMDGCSSQSPVIGVRSCLPSFWLMITVIFVILHVVIMILFMKAGHIILVFMTCSCLSGGGGLGCSNYFRSRLLGIPFTSWGLDIWLNDCFIFLKTAYFSDLSLLFPDFTLPPKGGGANVAFI